MTTNYNGLKTLEQRSHKFQNRTSKGERKERRRITRNTDILKLEQATVPEVRRKDPNEKEADQSQSFYSTTLYHLNILSDIKLHHTVIKQW
jgi:hypothetical protein